MHDGPYAFRTVLGWCISGSLKLNRDEDSTSILCNRIALQDISTGEVANHQLVVPDKIQDDEISSKLLQMYQTEFIENLKDTKALSVEDRKFLEIMEHGASRNGKHHALPLPLRNNNRVATI